MGVLVTCFACDCLGALSVAFDVVLVCGFLVTFGVWVGVMYACWAVGLLRVVWFWDGLLGLLLGVLVLFWLRGLADCFRFLWDWCDTRLLVVECLRYFFGTWLGFGFW